MDFLVGQPIGFLFCWTIPTTKTTVVMDHLWYCDKKDEAGVDPVGGVDLGWILSYL